MRLRNCLCELLGLKQALKKLYLGLLVLRGEKRLGHMLRNRNPTLPDAF